MESSADGITVGESEKIMNNLININEIQSLDLSKVKNAALKKESESLSGLQSKIASGLINAATGVEAIRREQAAILNRIQSTKLYEKDGFKSLADFAETIGLGKANAHALANAGKVYADKTAPDAIKNMTPSNIAAIMSAINADKKRVYSDAESGTLNGMTQKQLKEYASKVKPAKATVVKTYLAFVRRDDETIQEEPDTATDGRMDATMDEWRADAERAHWEFIPIPNDKDGNKRALVHDPKDGYAVVYTFVEYKPNANGKAKATTGKAEFLARAYAEGMTEEQIKTVCKVMGW